MTPLPTSDDDQRVITTGRTVRRVLSGATLRALADGHPGVRAAVEAAACDAAGHARDTAGLSITWLAHCSGTERLKDHPMSTQPRSGIERHSWQPGTDLPAAALYATCTVTVQ